jgi:hypothetical protein
MRKNLLWFLLNLALRDNIPLLPNSFSKNNKIIDVNDHLTIVHLQYAI